MQVFKARSHRDWRIWCAWENCTPECTPKYTPDYAYYDYYAYYAGEHAREHARLRQVVFAFPKRLGVVGVVGVHSGVLILYFPTHARYASPDGTGPLVFRVCLEHRHSRI